MVQPRDEGAGGGSVEEAPHDPSHFNPHLLQLRRRHAPPIVHRQQQLVRHLLHHPTADLLQALHLGPGGKRGGNRPISNTCHNLLRGVPVRLLLGHHIQPGHKRTPSGGHGELADAPSHRHSHGLEMLNHVRPRDESTSRGGVAEATDDPLHLDAHLLRLGGRNAPLVQHRQQQLVDDLLHHAAADLLQPLHLGPGGKRRGKSGVEDAAHDLLGSFTLDLEVHDSFGPPVECAGRRSHAEAANHSG